MEYRVLLRHKVKVYGDSFYVELREQPKREGKSLFHLVDIYENCEHDRGIHTIEDAILGFESTCGIAVHEDLKAYLLKR